MTYQSVITQLQVKVKCHKNNKLPISGSTKYFGDNSSVLLLPWATNSNSYSAKYKQLYTFLTHILYVLSNPAAGVRFRVRSEILIYILGLDVCPLSVLPCVVFGGGPDILLTTHSWLPAPCIYLCVLIHGLLLLAKWI